jgi:hypothetical protein
VRPQPPARIPREFHFVFGLRPQVEPMHVAHFLCLESCRRVNRPAAIHLHCRHRPHGAWWERIARHVTLHAIDRAPAGFAPERYAASAEGRGIAALGLDYAHEADFVRLDILATRGGVYADMDTLFVAPYPERWFARDCVLGEEPLMPRDGVRVPSLCNAVILAAPGAPFIARWRDAAIASFDGTWDRHSCRAASALWRAHPGEVDVLPQAAFYRHGATRAGIAALFHEDDTDLRGVCSLHLWAHLWWSATRDDFTSFHAGMITPAWLRSAPATYARLARRYLPADAGASSTVAG